MRIFLSNYEAAYVRRAVQDAADETVPGQSLKAWAGRQELLRIVKKLDKALGRNKTEEKPNG